MIDRTTHVNHVHDALPLNAILTTRLSDPRTSIRPSVQFDFVSRHRPGLSRHS
ncbi:hypothetical protein M407DRAFT_246495 [Tulasnella calospora MUT 4182]|uniref:Uncharacterized protein n=1 Tax=Tulasnella calospora MUT 4182 TaxID=1051891 RepID=A0A0C3KAG4_9AGAM|nr:hypothetical protein M407DRAFT_246495 [Tulasnella calospora MUT 4182]